MVTTHDNLVEVNYSTTLVNGYCSKTALSCQFAACRFGEEKERCGGCGDSEARASEEKAQGALARDIIQMLPTASSSTKPIRPPPTDQPSF
jgi:hypothetical protein